jgi:hypothetical protein
VPERGLAIAHDDVSFENCDFVWDHGAAGRGNRLASSAMLVVRAPMITFHGCSFSTRSGQPPAAFAWQVAAADLPMAGNVTLRNCLFDGLAAVVDAPEGGSFTLSLQNSLCVASGPLARLHRQPLAHESIAIALDHVTTRGDSAVLECRFFSSNAEEPGPLQIMANDSVLASNSKTGLLAFSMPLNPEQVLGSIRWHGAGSIVTPRTPLALWHPPGKAAQPLDETSLEVAGLVRSEVQFAGEASGPATASRVTRWQVPLRSPDAPGANPDLLPAPQGRLAARHAEAKQ